MGAEGSSGSANILAGSWEGYPSLKIIKWHGRLGQAGSGFISHSHNSPASCGALSGWLAHARLVSDHPWGRQRPFLIWAL